MDRRVDNMRSYGNVGGVVACKVKACLRSIRVNRIGLIISVIVLQCVGR